MTEESKSPKFVAFVAELKEICRRHGVTISTSQYDNIQVWNFHPGFGEIWGEDSMEDRTKDQDT